MSKLKTKTFAKGGVHSSDNKLSKDSPIEKLPFLAETVVIPVSQHIGMPANPIVTINDQVKVGQVIAESSGFISTNIHSSVSGTVKKIDDVLDVTGYKSKAIIIQTENDEWLGDIDFSDQIKREITVNADEIKEKVLKSGIVGLGGAAFPSHVKLSPPQGKDVEFLCVNGVECEPYLTSDHRLMLEKGEEIIIGIQITLKALGIEKALIGIEKNKPDAIKHLSSLTRHYDGIDVHPLKVQYPQGGERQLVKALVDREIPPPPRGLPIDVGCVVFNVGTIFAIYEAVQKNKPLIERVVCITGPHVKKPSNYLVRIGTPVSKLIEAAGGLPEDTGKILSGGPMMGKALKDLEIPITKGASGILIIPSDQANRKEVINCIRCGKCVSVCPLGLEPYLMMTVSEKGLLEKAEEEKITNCCECACCQFICPSNRPLLDYIRLGKTKVLEIMRNREKNER